MDLGVGMELLLLLIVGGAKAGFLFLFRAAGVLEVG